MYALGAVLVVAGLILLFFESGLAGWIPSGIAAAGLIILIGLFVLGLSDSGREDANVRTEHVEHHHRDD